MPTYSIDELRRIITPIAQEHGVESVSLFGSYSGIVLKKMDGQWSPPKAAIYDKTDHNPVHAMAF